VTLYQVLLRNVTAGIEVSPDGIVVTAAPVLKKFMGARLDKLRGWVERQGGTVKEVRREKEKIVQ